MKYVYAKKERILDADYLEERGKQEEERKEHTFRTAERAVRVL